MDIPFLIPGTTDPAIIIRRSRLGNISVLVNGRPVKRSRGMKYDIPLADGTVTELRLTGQWRGLKATVNGVETPLEPPVSPIFVGLIFLPLLLIVVGGLIGGLIGVVTSGFNLTISRSVMRGPLKLIAMLGTTVLGAAVWFGLALAITPIPVLETGTCVNGIHIGGDLTSSSYRPVNCAPAHDNEVVGSVRYDGKGAYPGGATLLAFAQTPCANAFAAYVGIDFQLSSLEMIIVTPSDLSWVKGDRVIACVALAPDGGRLTGSIRGTAR